MRRTPAIRIKIPGSALLLLTLVWLTGTSYGPAQIYRPNQRPNPGPPRTPVEVAGYLAIGFANLEAPPHQGAIAIGTAGMYGQWTRGGFSPGLDLRWQGNDSYLHGVLAGPRLSYRSDGNLRSFHPYVEALFGPNQFSSSLPGYDPAAVKTGVTSMGAIGLDVDYTPTIRWRVLEYTKGYFSGGGGLQPYTLSTGIVLHLP